MTGNKLGEFGKGCSTGMYIFDLSINQGFSKFSVHLYLGLTHFDSAVLSWDEVSVLINTQMILMQAIFQYALRNSDLQI